MISIDLFVPGDPKGQPRPRAFSINGSARVFDPGTAEGWKSQVADALKRAGQIPPAPIDSPVAVVLFFQFRRPKTHLRTNGQVKPAAPLHHTSKPDCDNAAKAVLDALTTLGVWCDDSLVSDLTVTKAYGEPGVLIRVTPAPEYPREHREVRPRAEHIEGTLL